MLLILIMMSFSMSVIFMFLSHPLSLGFVILLQTIAVALICGMMNFDLWFSYILFLIMIGGMLVLFIYMTSVASNEKFSFSKIMMVFIISLFIFSLLGNMADNFFYMFNLSNMDTMNQENPMAENLSMSKYMNYPNMLIMVILMMYLLVTLIAIVKVTSSTLGPLRQKN